MTAEYDMEDLTGRDLDRAHESLYYAAKRYCTITEQGFIQDASGTRPSDPSFMNIGAAAHDLTEAGQRYTEVYDRWQACLPPVTTIGEDQD